MSKQCVLSCAKQELLRCPLNCFYLPSDHPWHCQWAKNPSRWKQSQMHLVVQGGSRRKQHGPAQKGQRVFDLEIINELVDEWMSAKCYLLATSRIAFRSAPLYTRPQRQVARQWGQPHRRVQRRPASRSLSAISWRLGFSATDSYPACS